MNLRIAVACAAGLALALIVGQGVWQKPETPSPPAPPVAAGTSVLALPLDVPAAEAPAVAASAAIQSATACAHQHIELMLADATEHACVSDTRSTQKGSVREHLVAAEGTSRWNLRVDVADGRAVAVRAWASAAVPGSPPLVYRCTRGRCQGLAIGKPDSQGASTLTLREVSLQAGGASAASAAGAASAGTGASVAPPLRLSAQLRLVPEAQIPGLACEPAAVTVMEADGSRTDFCALGGAGYELADDGRRSYQFRNLEGRMLAVGLAPDGMLEKVTLGALGCAAPYCGGVTMSLLHAEVDTPGAARRFSFSGTSLRLGDEPGARSATLSGSVIMPQQED